ncbi:unnamed protein product [Vicia faba]|uniref:Uncharacterized protein n=1 Tax=Vicia faba TaxID=3906 RepID=A0AAV0ZVI3_VICFA|nr:unnamed protein product [Vicia faba]
MLAYELLKGYSRKGGIPRCMMQINLQKADMVDWFAMEKVLQEIGIPSMFIQRVMTVVNSVTYMFNINGEISGTMQPKCGIRQGVQSPPLICHNDGVFEQTSC